MEYSITSLARQARVSVRTLRHYDTIGLLKPSIRMASGKRFYGDEQFLRLFEILFFKKIGLSLSTIKGLFLTKTYNKTVVSILMKKRQELDKEIKRLQLYANSIDISIPYYKNSTLSQKERLDKFQSLQNSMKEVEVMQVKEFGNEKMKEAKEKIIALTEEQIEERVDQSNKLMKEAIQAINERLKPDSKEVQQMMKRYYDFITEFNPITKEAFLKLRDIVLEQREIYARYHPKMPEFLYKAMSEFAKDFPV